MCRWMEENQAAANGGIDWDLFTKESFNNFRKQAPKDDLDEILKELGIYNERVVKALEEKNVLRPEHLVQKSKAWLEKLDDKDDLLLNGTDKYAIEKFREWYSFHMIGYLPSDWIVSFRNSDAQPKERELRKVLTVSIGIKERFRSWKDKATLKTLFVNKVNGGKGSSIDYNRGE